MESGEWTPEMEKEGMKRTLCAIAGVLVASAMTVGPVNRTAVHAADVCEAAVTWSFSPALSLSLVNNGSLTFAFTDSCVHADASGATGLFNNSGVGQFTYSGSCLTASFAGPGNNSGVIIGGLVAVLTSPFPQAYVLETLTPCNDAGPTPSIGVLAAV